MLKNIFDSTQVLTSTKLQIPVYEALLESIFFYNCETWRTTKEEENKINISKGVYYVTFQVGNRKRGNWISNDELWSKTIAYRRLCLLEHIARLDDKAQQQPYMKQ